MPGNGEGIVGIPEGAGLGQQLNNRDLAEGGAVDHDRYILAWCVDLAGAIPVGLRSLIDLDLAVDEVHNPVDRNPAAGVRVELLGPVENEALLRDLDDERNVAPSGCSA